MSEESGEGVRAIQRLPSVDPGAVCFPAVERPRHFPHPPSAATNHERPFPKRRRALPSSTLPPARPSAAPAPSLRQTPLRSHPLHFPPLQRIFARFPCYLSLRPPRRIHAWGQCRAARGFPTCNARPPRARASDDIPASHPRVPSTQASSRSRPQPSPRCVVSLPPSLRPYHGYVASFAQAPQHAAPTQHFAPAQ